MNIAGKKKEISKMKIASGKFLRFAGNIALLLVAGGCATTEVERLEKAIIEKDYMADEEIARLRSLAYPDRTDDNKPVHASPDAVAAYYRISEAKMKREKYFGRKSLDDIFVLHLLFKEAGYVSYDNLGCSMLLVGLGDMLGDCGKSNEMMRCYTTAASNGLWIAQKRLYDLYLDTNKVYYSVMDAVPWLNLAIGQGDAFAAETLAKLCEDGLIPCESDMHPGVLYGNAARSYVELWKDMAMRASVAAGLRTAPASLQARVMQDCGIVGFCDFEYRKDPDYYLLGCSPHDTIVRCFKKAIELGDNTAETDFRNYQNDFNYYCENLVLPESFADENNDVELNKEKKECQ